MCVSEASMISSTVRYRGQISTIRMAYKYMDEKEMTYRYWLNCIEGIGRKTAMVLTAFAGSGEDIYRLPEQELKWLLSEKQLCRLIQSRKTWDVAGEYARLREKGIHFYPWGHSDYPEKFLHLPDPPAAFYVKGSLPAVNLRTVALIGTRQCSGYGSMMAKEMGHALARAGVQVVSGMARGIDGIGQRAVTEAGGSTFAVLGCGADICYPEENRRLYQAIAERGGIISEYPPGTLPKAVLFPPRNRIISGLSDCVVVVEAKEKSGTMITVDMALEQGREVYAMPGRVVDGLSSGCNRLIRQGAGIICSAEDFLAELGVSGQISDGSDDEKISVKISGLSDQHRLTGKINFTGPEAMTEQYTWDGKGDKKESDEGLTATERTVLYSLINEPKPLDHIALLCSDLTLNRLTAILVSLCLKGKAEQVGIGLYRRRECS